MSLKERLAERAITKRVVDLAVVNTEKVLATVILNASKNVTNAQAMKGNTSALAADLETMYALQKEFDTEEKKPRGRPKKEEAPVEDLEAKIAPVAREGKQE